MAYTPNIPASTDLISNSQSQIQANFNALDTEYGGDHDGFSIGASNSGMHKKATFLSNISAPGLTVNGTNGVAAIFANLDANSISQLFFQNGSGTQQITSSQTTLGSFTGFNLPGGLKLCISNGTVTFALAGSPYTLPLTYTSTSTFVVLCTASGGTPTIRWSVNNTGNNTFTGFANPGNNQMFVVAIGY